MIILENSVVKMREEREFSIFSAYIIYGMMIQSGENYG
jgi:hypothetical protein